MADNTIKEFLVSLGFTVDGQSLSKWGTFLAKAEGLATNYALAVTAAAAATAVFVDKMASGLADMYWASVRLRDSVANIKDFQLSVREFGGDAGQALQSLEGIAHYLRTNPAGESFMKYLGIQTRDAEGHLRGATDLLKQLAALPLPYWLKVRFAEKFGIDEDTLQATIRGAGKATSALSDLYSRVGLDATKAAEASKDWKNQTYLLKGSLDVLGAYLENKLLPMFSKLVTWVQNAVVWFADMDRATNGWLSTISGGAIATLLTLAGAVAAVGLAVRVVTSAVTALRFAWLALQVLFLESPIGWITLALAALAYAAYEVIQNWDKVKSWYNSFVSWMREKYNTVAKYLGLPQWEAPTNKLEAGDTGLVTTSGQTAIAAPVEPAQAGAPGAPGLPGQAGEPGQPGQAGVAGQPGTAAETGGDFAPSFVYGGQPQQPPVRQTVPTEEPVPGYEGDVPQRVATGKALDFFKKVGRTAEQSAGIVANLIKESGLNPNAVGDNGKAYGIAQWHKDRQAEFARVFGHDIHGSSLQEQLQFVQYELSKGAEKFAGALLAQTKTAAEAGAVVSRYYERPANADREAFLRGAHAVKLLNNTRLAGNTSHRSVTINQKNDIKVSGVSDPHKAAKEVADSQGRVVGDLSRNFAGATM